jgi:Tol biopolymer transport system component
MGFLEISADGDHVFFLQWTRDEPGEIHRIPLLGGVSRRVIRDARKHFSLSPHDGRIAFNRVANDTLIIMVANLDGSEERELTRLPVLTDLPLAWSPNGQVIYSSSWKSRSEPFGVELVEIPVAGGAPRTIASERWTFVDDILCLPDGSGLVFVGIRGNQRYQDPTGLFLFSLGEEGFHRITQDLFEYFHVSCDREGKQLVAVQRSGQQGVLILPADHPERSRQLFFVSHVGGHYSQATWTPEGRVLTEHKAGENLQIISLNPDGKEFHPITYEGSLNMGACVSPDGDRVAFFSNRSGSMKIWIADITGSNPRRLSDEEWEGFFPQFTPDGQWIVYHAFVDQKWSLRKIPVSGGSSVPLIDVPSFYARISHDGNWIACHVMDMEDGDYRLALVPIDGGSHRFLDAEPGLRLHCWMPDDDGLTCSLREEGVDNIWVVPLDGSPPQQMTHFEEGTIPGADWNAAGDSLAVVQRERSSDVVLLRNFLP